MKRRNRINLWLIFLIIFLVNAFVITSSFMLFFNYMEIDTEHIHLAAVFTFGNVILITFLFVGVYSLIEYFTVKRPLRKIVGGLERITKGDFSVRLDDHGINSDLQ